MFELIMIFLGAMPFLIGVYAIRTIRKGNNRGSDDPPPPPDPAPPRPVLPPAPEPKRIHNPIQSHLQRDPVKRGRLQMAGWRRTVREVRMEV